MYNERCFDNFDFDCNLIYLSPRMVTVNTKVKVFQYKILNNILLVNKIFFKRWKAESSFWFSCKAEDETYIHLFHRCIKTSILWRKRQKFFSTAINLNSILPQSSIFDFLDDALERKLLINHILLIFKIY